MLMRLACGASLWLIPYVTAIPLMPLIHSDNTFFKTIMIVDGALLGAAQTAHYFLAVERDVLRDGLLFAAVSIALNWLLDIVALLPFTKQTLPRYFMEIGLPYLAIAASAVAVGYVHDKRVSSKRGDPYAAAIGLSIGTLANTQPEQTSRKDDIADQECDCCERDLCRPQSHRLFGNEQW